MRPWHIEWTQTTDGEEKHFTDAFVAETPALAIAQWEAKSYCNARIDAVYDPQKFEIKRCAAIGETVADPAAGTGKLPPVGEEVKEDWLDMPRGTFAAPKDLNAGQRPGLVGCASTPPAGGARHSAFNHN